MACHQLTLRVLQVLLLCGLLIPGTLQSTVSKPPQSTVVEVGDNAQFFCKIETTDPDEYTFWGRYGSSITDLETIFRTDDPDFPIDKKKYEFKETAPFDTSIMVKNVIWTDSGTYVCIPGRDFVEYKIAELVVMEKPSISVPQLLVDGREAILGCEFTYSGTPKLKASITAKIGDLTLNPNITETPGNEPNKLTLTFDHNITMSAENHQQNFTCIATIETIPVEITASQTLDVQYPVSEVKINTVKEVYHPGEGINCTANGNPSPEFNWIPHGNSDRDSVDGQVLTITVEMVGENQWTCVAKNVIDGMETTNRSSPLISFRVSEPPAAESRGNDAAIAVGVVVPLLVIAIVVIVVILLMKRRKSKEQADSPETTPKSSPPPNSAKSSSGPTKDPQPKSSGTSAYPEKPDKPDASSYNPGFAGSPDEVDMAALSRRTLTPPPADGRPYSPYDQPHMTNGRPYSPYDPAPKTDGRPYSPYDPAPKTDGRPYSPYDPAPKTDGRPYSPYDPASRPPPVPEADVELDEEPTRLRADPSTDDEAPSGDLGGDIGGHSRYQNVPSSAPGTEV